MKRFLCSECTGWNVRAGTDRKVKGTGAVSGKRQGKTSGEEGICRLKEAALKKREIKAEDEGDGRGVRQIFAGYIGSGRKIQLTDSIADEYYVKQA